MADLPPNHHADYPQFSGIRGYVGGLTMIIGRGPAARFVAEFGDVTDHDRVLDIGCGPGTAVREAARTGAHATGLDPSGPMLRLARLLTRLRRPKGAIDWVEAGAENLGLPSESITVCWSIASVHHWPELEPGLDEVERVLAPGGRFIAIEKRAKPGATGNASHGWTPDQADLFAKMLADRGLTETSVSNHEVGPKGIVAVAATKPGAEDASS